MVAKILVGEDDFEACETYQDILRGMDCEVNIVHTAEKAMSELTRFMPDTVLLDLQLPKASGVTVLAFIRKHPRLKNTRVVIISGDTALASHTANYWEADQWLAKPVSVQDLRDAVGTLMP